MLKTITYSSKGPNIRVNKTDYLVWMQYEVHGGCLLSKFFTQAKRPQGKYRRNEFNTVSFVSITSFIVSHSMSRKL